VCLRRTGRNILICRSWGCYRGKYFSIKELEIPFAESLLKGIGQGAPSFQLCINPATAQTGHSGGGALSLQHSEQGSHFSVCIKSVFEFPHSYRFAEIVAQANGNGARWRTVMIDAARPHVLNSYDGAVRCIPERCQALTVLLKCGVTHLTVPNEGWFADIDDNELTDAGEELLAFEP
jgi:hypothetical protein